MPQSPRPANPVEGYHLSICFSPAFQRTIVLDQFERGGLNRSDAVFVDASGKGMNVARSLSRKGYRALHLGPGGPNAPEYIRLARTEGIRVDCIDAPLPIRTCISLVEERVVSEIIEQAPAVDDDFRGRFLAHLDALLPEAQSLSVSGSFPPGLGDDISAEIVARACQRGIRSLVDIRGMPLLHALGQSPDVVKINAAECFHTFRPDEASILQAEDERGSAHALKELTAILEDVSEDNQTLFVVTRGGRPLMWARDGVVSEHRIPALEAPQVRNPVGSGDAFLAGLVAGLDQLHAARSESLAAALDIASSWARENARELRPGWVSLKRD